MDSRSATELYNKCQADFLAMRAKTELTVQTYFEKIGCIDPSIFEGKVEIPEGASLKTLVPEYYVANPRQAVLDAQIDAANELFGKINKVLTDICQEAVKCYSEYQVLASSGQ